MGKQVRERISQVAFAFCGVVVVLLVASLFIFVGSKSYQTFTVHHVSLGQMLTGKQWNPGNDQVGALVLIVGTVTTTALAVLLATPVSIGIAVFVTQIAPPWARRLMQPVLELFIGIPSIIYGFLGLVIIVPLIAKIYNNIAGGFLYAGYGVVAAAIVLAVMIMPTIATVSIDALASLPIGLREASLALGATRWQTVRKTLLPAATPGVLTGVILGIGRAVGETLAVSFVIGSNASRFPLSFNGLFPYLHLYPTSTLTVQMLLDFGEVTPGTLSFDALWTLAFFLLIIAFVLVLASRWVASHGVYSEKQPQQSWLRRLLQRNSVDAAEARSVAG